jgi:sortase A
VQKKGSAEDLSIEQLRRLLVEKRRASRQERIERFRRTGRVVVVTPDLEGTRLEDLRTGILPEPTEIPAYNPPRSKRKRILDSLLLVIELLAVIGLLFVLFNGVNLIRELNQEVVSALAQPTLTPTPLIVAVVLPSGHTPPNSPGGARPNEAEIPEHLRPLVQSLAEIPVPTPGPEQALRIQIPSIGIDAPVVQGDGWEQLKKGVAQHLGTANPGQKGNMVLSAHNDIFGEIFRDLDRLKPGDQVIVYTNQRAYTYVVNGSRIVEPTQVEAMEPTSHPAITLISCYPYLVDDQRIVVSARLETDTN